MLDYGLNIQMRCSRRLEGRFKLNQKDSFLGSSRIGLTFRRRVRAELPIVEVNQTVSARVRIVEYDPNATFASVQRVRFNWLSL